MGGFEETYKDGTSSVDSIGRSRVIVYNCCREGQQERQQRADLVGNDVPLCLRITRERVCYDD